MKYLLAESVQHLNIPPIVWEKKIFPDGEFLIRITEKITGKELTIITNITPTNLFDVLCTIDAARRSGAKIKKMIIPYMAFARQDRVVEEGEAVGGAVICSALKQFNIPITVIDFHSERICTHFSRRSVLLFLAQALQNEKQKLEQYTIVAPDEGSRKRASLIAKALKLPLVVLQKARKGQEINVTLTSSLPTTSVILIDDMISTGGTLCTAAKVLRNAGAKKIAGIATHGLLAGKAREKLRKTGINPVIVSNSLPVKPSAGVKVIKIETELKRIALE